MSEPLVSVIIPSYERFDSLLIAIESIENQTYKNYEVIIVDDASKDKRYKGLNKNKNLRIIHLEKNSVEMKGYFSDSIRNHGIKHASGKYLAFLDDDDYWFPEKLELQVKKLETTDFRMCASEAFANNGTYDKNLKNKLYNQELVFKEIANIYKKSSLNSTFKSFFSFKFYFPEVWNSKFIKIHNCIITSSVVVEKDLLNQVGNFRDIQSKKLWSDWDCWLGVLTHTDCYYFSEPLIYYDLNEGLNANPT